MRNFIPLVFLTFICSSVAAYAHHPGVATGGSGAACSTVITVPPYTLPRCSWSAGIQEQFIKFDTWSTETLLHKAEENPGTEIETLDYISQTSLFFSYGICDNLMLTLSLPYISFTEIRHAEPEDEEEFEAHDQGDSNGLGDLSVLFTWKFFENHCSNTSAAFLFGVTAPTGRTDIKDTHGERFSGDHQPGTGSFNPLVGLAVCKLWDQSGIYANVFYTDRTKGAHHTHLGDIFNYNFAAAHQFRFVSKRCCSPNDREHSHSQAHDHGEEASIAIDALIELCGTVEGKDRLDGEVNVNSGGHILYLFPGIRFLSGTKGLSCGYLSLGWPIYQDLNGSQTKSKLQVLFGMTLEF